MGFMDNVRTKMRSWLQINPPSAMLINIQESLDFEGNAIKNRIWYRGDATELEQLYWQIPRYVYGGSGEYQRFWSSHATPGMEMRKVHTGLPATMVDILAGIITANVNDFTFDGNKPIEELWNDHINKENEFKTLIEKSIKTTLVVGDGAWKISIDPEISEYPIVEFWAGDKVEFRRKRGRIQEIVFKSFHNTEVGELQLKEIYGRGYIDYELYRGDEPIDMGVDERFEGLVRVEWEDDFMLAVPSKYYDSHKYEGRGQSIFDKKIDAFDAFDEAYSQWIDALRAGRTKVYIPENLIPRDAKTGKVLRPNPFDNRYIQTDADMKERAGNKITTEAGEIRYDAYLATYATALELCLQGIMSPATLGIDVKKLDNAEAQREKEKVTLYTRDAIIEALQPQLEQVVEVTIKAYYMTVNMEVPEYEATITFQDYANPSFESQIETVGLGRQHGILSIEACVEELYGDDKTDEWKQEEVARLKNEQGLTEMEEPAVASELFSQYKQANEQVAQFS